VWGQVHVYFGKKGAIIGEGAADFLIKTEEDLTYFGDVLATGDVDQDGNLDLLVGSPFSSSEEHKPNPNPNPNPNLNLNP